MSTGAQIIQVYGSIDCVYTVCPYSILWCQHGQGYSEESFAKGSSFSGPWHSASHLPLTTLANRPRASRAAVSENVHVLAWDHGRPRSRDEGMDDLWKLSSERHTWTVDHERRRIDWCRLLSGPAKIVVHIGTEKLTEEGKKYKQWYDNLLAKHVGAIYQLEDQRIEIFELREQLGEQIAEKKASGTLINLVK